jgi:hypothetical protein
VLVSSAPVLLAIWAVLLLSVPLLSVLLMMLSVTGLLARVVSAAHCLLGTTADTDDSRCLRVLGFILGCVLTGPKPAGAGTHDGCRCMLLLLLLLCAEVHMRLAGWACHGSCSCL